MSIRLVGIGGLPCAGKTTLVKSFMSQIGGEWIDCKIGLLRWQFNEDKGLAVLGVYDGEGTFQGTDRLSMAVQPHALAAVEKWAKEGLGVKAVLFEGDRLFNGSFISAVSGMRDVYAQWIILTAPDLRERAKVRGDKQGETWLKGRASKLLSIRNRFAIELRNNDGELEMVHNIATLRSWLRID